MLGLVLLLLLVGCAGAQKPACSLDRLRALKEQCTAELVDACHGVPRDEPCPGAADVLRRCRERRAEWAACR